MKPSIILFVGVAAPPAYAATKDPFEQWEGPGASDVRGPCPFLNTFANHGFLPRSGKYITEKNLVEGIFNAVWFDAGVSKFLFDFAVTTNPEPNATWFSLDHLTRHNILEHDASLSRVDTFFGHADIFREEAFDETRSYWGDVIDAENAADALVARLTRSKKTNPQFSLSPLGEGFILGENAAFIGILGDSTALTVNKTLVEYLFEHERLPTELGWKRRGSPYTKEILFQGLARIRAEYEKRLKSTSYVTRNVGYERGMGHRNNIIL